MASSSQGRGEIEAAKRSLATAKKWAASMDQTLQVAQERLKDAEKQANVAWGQVYEAEEYLMSVKRKWETKPANDKRLLTTMMAKLSQHTECTICYQKFSTDIRNKNENVRRHLPVLSSSPKCDHYFCHGCILRDQQRVADLNNGRVPKWIKCMNCRENTSFCPSEPKYHRLLIELLGGDSATGAACQSTKVNEKQQAPTQGMGKDEMAASLSVGDWAMFDGNGEKDQPIWLGRVVSKPDLGGQGCWRNDTGKRAVFDGVPIERNEHAINIIWYEKINLNGRPGLEYHVSRENAPELA